MHEIKIHLLGKVNFICLLNLNSYEPSMAISQKTISHCDTLMYIDTFLLSLAIFNLVLSTVQSSIYDLAIILALNFIS